MTQFKITSKNPTGTSFHDTVILATPNQLIQVLGRPTYDQNDGSDKVNIEWYLELSDGNVFTVYDYKEYHTLGMDELIEWHIGGHSKEITDKAKQNIELAFNEANIVINNDLIEIEEHTTYTTNIFTIWYKGNEYMVRFNESFDDYLVPEVEIERTDGEEIDEETEDFIAQQLAPKCKVVK